MSAFAAASCTGKVRFDSHGAAMRVQKRRGRDRQYRKGEVYRCKVCHGWHIGSRKLQELPKQEFRRYRARYLEAAE